MKYTLLICLLVCAGVFLNGCRKHDPYLEDYTPTPYSVDYPQGFPQMEIPEDNPMTVEGVELGRKLFYDEILSLDYSISCGSCHAPYAGFSDTAQYSKGVNGALGNRQAMALINLGYSSGFFWDGRAATLEQQILGPVPNPVEMHLEWTEAVNRIQNHATYPYLFKKAFNTYEISKELVAKAIAQFLRTMISGNSKFDKVLHLQDSFTTDEAYGYDLFMRDKNESAGIVGGDCFHCHPAPIFYQLNTEYLNNGLDASFTDLGRGQFTGNVNDNGKFKIPTLRNIELSAPYMHDGRFTTLDQVVEHYSTGLQNSATISPLMKEVDNGGLLLPPYEKSCIIAFLKTLTDYEFINNPEFKDPDL
ncbi:MAG TPA: cytochrome c peroxidase [Flavobacteriales bacterium]|nr:cytochrome c peroxidase [Flavobacteriales bacterium]